MDLTLNYSGRTVTGKAEWACLVKALIEGSLFDCLVDGMNEGLHPDLYGSHRSDIINRAYTANNTIERHYRTQLFLEPWYELGKAAGPQALLPDLWETP
jgi:hypothetical protein